MTDKLKLISAKVKFILYLILSSRYKLDIKTCREQKSYSFIEYFGRILWSLISPFFYYSPRNFFFWRSFLLRMFGAKVGKNVNIYPTAKIYIPWNLIIDDFSSIGEWVLIYNLGMVEIGSSVTISHKAQLCSGTHDYANANLPLLKKTIIIRDYVWICTDAFIGPGCEIGEGSIIGAKSVVVKSVESWGIFAGNPAKFLKKREISKT